MKNKAYGEIEVKKDCFAYKQERGFENCKALKCLYCAKEKCIFYKTAEQYNKEIKKYRL